MLRLTDNAVSLATWNVRSLYKPGALANLINELENARVKIAAIQEMRWKGTDVWKYKNFTLYYSGNETHTLGVGFAVRRHFKNAVIGFTALNERLCSIRVKGQCFNVTLICAHAPTEEADEDSKETFYAQLERLYDMAPHYDIKIILGDLNAKIGKEEDLTPTIGKHSLHEESNDNGLKLVSFAASKGMVISSTYFQHKRIHKTTWKSPDGVTENQIDHVLIDHRHKSDILDTRTYRGADVDSDHYLVRATYKQRISTKKQRTGKTKPRFDSERLLREAEVAKRYSEKVTAHLQSEMPNTDVEREWSNIKDAVIAAAEMAVGEREPNTREEWFDGDCKKALEDRNRARKAQLQRKTRAAAAEYAEKRKVATKLCRRKKREWEKQKLEKIMQLAEDRESRAMYARIKGERNGFQPRAVAVSAKDGSLIGEESAILDRWAEHFEELLNVEGGDQEDEPLWTADPTGVAPEEEPTISEVQDALNGMKNHKAAGEDGICVELLKKGGEELVNRIWNMVRQIWNKEEMPDEWRRALVCPIHKKGDKMNCTNYRGISLLNVTYKVFSRVLARRLNHLAESVVGDYQCGFRGNRSTIDQIHTIRIILEKCYEYNVDVHQLFVDFKQAYDSVKRKRLCEVLQELGVPQKIARLVWMTLKGSKNKVKVQNSTSHTFRVTRGLRQGDPISTVLFNFVLEHVIRNITTNPGGTLFNRSVFWTAYADDINITARNKRALKEAFAEMEEAAREVGLVVNEGKTKYMVMEKRGERVIQQPLICGSHSFEGVAAFKYLGTTITETNDRGNEIKQRIQAGNRSYYSLRKILSSKAISRKLKKLVYRTIIRPVVLYASETWVPTRREETLLNTWERRVLRKIYGPICENGQWRIRTNKEVYELYDEPTIVAEYKRSRLRWAGHLQRMADGRAAKKVWTQKPEGRRSLGRPRLRWEDGVQDDLRQLGVRGWRRRAQDRTAWREIVDQAQTLHGL